MSASLDIGSLTGQVALEDQASEVMFEVIQHAKHFVQEFEGLLGVVTLVGGAVTAAVAGAIISIEELGKHGSVILGVEQAFDKLAESVGTTGDALREGLSEGVKHTVGDLTLMETTSKLLTSGMKVTSDQMKLMGEVAREMGKATGQDASQALSTLTSALTTGNERMLKRAGIIPDVAKAEKELAHQLGVEVDQLNRAGVLEAKRTAQLAAYQTYLDKVGISQLSLKERFDQVSVSWEHWMEQLEKGIASSPAVMRAFDAIADAIKKNFGGAGQTVLDVIIDWVNRFAEAVAKYGPGIIDAIAEIGKQIVIVWHHVQDAWDLVPDWFKRLATEAGLAGVAVYGVSTALGGLSTLDVISGISNVVQIFQGLKLGGILTIPIITTIGSAIQNLSISEVFVLGWTAFVDGILALLATPLGLAAIIVGIGLAIYRLSEAVARLYEMWKKGEPMWNFFREGGGFWDNSMIGRWLGMSKSVDTASNSLKNLGEQRSGLEALMKIRGDIGPFVKPPASQEVGDKNLIKDNAKKVEEATKASIIKTQQLWDEYSALAEKDAGELFTYMVQGEGDFATAAGVASASAISSIDKWYQAELAALEKSKKNNLDYQNQKLAIDTLYAQKRTDAEIQYSLQTIEESESIGESAAAGVAKSLQGQPDVLRNMATQMAKFTDQTNTAKGAVHEFQSGILLASHGFVGIGQNIDSTFGDAHLGFAVRRLHDLGFSIKDIATITHSTFDQVSAEIDSSFDDFATMIDGMAQSLVQLAQVSQGAFGTVLQGISQVVLAGDRAIKSIQAYRAASSNSERGLAVAGAAAEGIGTFQAIKSGQMGAAAGIGSLAATGAGIGTMFMPGIGTGIGAGVGAVVGAIAYVMRDKTLINIAKDAGRNFGMTFSKETAEAIKASMKAGFSLNAAELANFGKIISDAGGINSTNLVTLTARLRDTFSMIETHQFTIAQGAKVIDENWQAFVEAGTDSAGFLSKALKEIIALNDRFGTQSKAIKEYLLGQADAAITAMNQIAAGTAKAAEGWDEIKKAIDSSNEAWDAAKKANDSVAMAKAQKDNLEAMTKQKDAAAEAKSELVNLGNITLATFNAAIKAGMSMPEALAKIKPTLDIVIKGFRDLGLNIDNAALKALGMMNDVFSKFPEIAQGLSGLINILPALSNLDALTPDTLAGVEAAGQAQFRRVQAGVSASGGTNTDALRIMQPYLHQAEAAAKQLGVEVDDFTRMLINQSKEAGIWQEAAKSASDKLIDADNALRDAVEANTRALRGEGNPYSGDRTNPGPGQPGGQAGPGIPVVTVPPGGEPRISTTSAGGTTYGPVSLTVQLPPDTNASDARQFAATLKKVLRDNTDEALTAVSAVASRAA